MNNPIDAMPFDVHSLIPYTEFNWDTVQGIDRVITDINKAEGRLTSGLAKNISKVQSVNGGVVTKLAKNLADRTAKVQSVVTDIQQNLAGQIGGNLVTTRTVAGSPNYNPYTDPVTGVIYEFECPSTDLVRPDCIPDPVDPGIEHCQKDCQEPVVLCPDGTPKPVDSECPTPVVDNPACSATNLLDWNSYAMQSLIAAFDSSDNAIQQGGWFIHDDGSFVLGYGNSPEFLKRFCSLGCAFSTFPTPWTVYSFNFKYNVPSQDHSSNNTIYWNENPDKIGSEFCEDPLLAYPKLNDLTVYHAQDPVASQDSFSAIWGPDVTATLLSLCCPISNPSPNPIPVPGGGGLPPPIILPPVPVPVPGPLPCPVPCPPAPINMSCPAPQVFIVPIVGPVPFPIGGVPLPNPIPIGGTPIPVPTPMPGPPIPVVIPPVVIPGVTPGTVPGSTGSGIPIDWLELCQCLTTTIQPLVEALQAGNETAIANGGGSDLEYITTLGDDKSMDDWLDNQGIPQDAGVPTETLGDVFTNIYQPIASAREPWGVS